MLLGHFWTGLKRAECCYLTAHISMDFSSPPAQTSTMVSNHSLHSLPFQKWDKKFPLGLKTPYRCTQLMHFTSKHPALFLWEKKSVPQRENTACFMNAAIIRHNTLLLCWMYHLWDIQKNTGSLSGPINLNWMPSSICLRSVCYHSGFKWRLSTALRHVACNFKNHPLLPFHDVTKLCCTINTC